LRRFFPNVKLIREHLRADDVPMNRNIIARHSTSGCGFLFAEPHSSRSVIES
jgi:hypothetical protein